MPIIVGAFENQIQQQYGAPATQGGNQLKTDPKITYSGPERKDHLYINVHTKRILNIRPYSVMDTMFSKNCKKQKSWWSKLDRFD